MNTEDFKLLVTQRVQTRDGGRVVEITEHNREAALAGTGGGVFRSTDDGKTWTR
jgi:photosystem II stability/assembly factor-like uncharacterized protein